MKVNCTHWSRCGNRYGGCCALNIPGQGPTPTFGVCSKCDQRDPLPGAVAQVLTVAGRVAHAAGSIAKTSVGIDLAPPEQVEARLSVCRKCPGGYAVWKDGDVHTCGPMVESLLAAGNSTCGCLLKKKALDAAEHCPFEWWPGDVANNAPPGDQK